MVFAETMSKLAGALSGPTNDPVGALGGAQFSPRVITGPVTVGGAPLPFTLSSSIAPNKMAGYGLGGTLTLPSPFLRVQSVPSAAGEFFQKEPGAELVSSAPGAADLWRDLVGGLLPTLRPAGQAHSVSDGGGFTGGALGSMSAGVGGSMGPWLIVGAVGFFALLYALRK